MNRKILWGVVFLLLVHFALRIHHITTQPIFIDEYSHISRAQKVYDFDTNPVQTSHGKLLLYFWMGIFNPAGEAAIPLARWSVALIAMLGAAGSAAVARELFGRRAVLPTVAFAALVPFGLFFERMALADPFAGALAALAVWASLRLTKQPTPRNGALAGLLITCATLGKLTTGLIVSLPLVAALLFAPERRAQALWKRYRRAWITAGVVFVMLWSLVLLAAMLNRLAGQIPSLLDTHLIESEAGASRMVDKLKDVVDRGDLLISAPLSLMLLALIGVLLGRKLRQGSYALIWLVLLWFPNIFIARTVQSRYLMVAMPAVAVIFGGGMAVLADWIGARRVPQKQPILNALIATVILVWAVGFALPFADKAQNDPVKLTLPETDRYNYFWGAFNGWGTRESIAYILAHGQRTDGTIPVSAMLAACSHTEIYLTDAIEWACISPFKFADSHLPTDPAAWWPLVDQVGQWGYTYFLTDYPDLVPLDQPPTLSGTTWTLAFQFTRPFGGKTVAVWRVERTNARFQLQPVEKVRILERSTS